MVYPRQGPVESGSRVFNKHRKMACQQLQGKETQKAIIAMNSNYYGRTFGRTQKKNFHLKYDRCVT